jgi:iron(III) transport system permease protein
MGKWLGPLTALIFLLISALILLPLIFLVFGAFWSGGPGERGASFTWKNVHLVYLSGSYLAPLLNTLKIAFLTTVTAVPFGALLAWILGRTNVPCRKLLELLLIIPIFISPLIGALSWIALGAPRSGFVNVIWTRFLGQSQNLVNIFSLSGIVFVMFLYFVPYAYLFVVGALKNMDPNIEDASRMLGGGILTTLRRITFPLIKPALFSSALLIFVLSAELFSVPTMLGTPIRIQTIPSNIYFAVDYGGGMANEAAAAGTMLFWITAGGILIYYRMVRESRRYVTISGKGYRPRIIDLGKGKFIALGVYLFYLLLSVVLPYLSLLLGSFMKYMTPDLSWQLFTLKNYRDLLLPENFLAIKNTLFLAVVGASISVIFCILVSFVSLRTKNWLGRAVDYLAMLPISIPAIALAVGMLWAYITLPLYLYGTIWILLVAYMTRFLGYGVRIFSSSLVQIDPELEEASRISGASPYRTMWRITTPLLRPAMLSAWTMLFVFFTVEISASILLYTSKTITMSVAMWNFLAMGGSINAFAIGIVQTTIVFIVLAIAHKISGSYAVFVE